MTLALFDLDNTLINGDSDYAWGKFLVDQQLVEKEVMQAVNDKFFMAYQNGNLNIDEYLEFALAFLKDKSPHELAPLHEKFMAIEIEPILLPKAFALIDHHRSLGHDLLMITATNRFVTGPIAKRLGFDQLIACEPELENGRYTGKATGTPSFQHGKVVRLNQWLDDKQADLKDSWFYSDSHNDLPLLEQVDHPVAVNPDQTLHNIAMERGWSILDLRDNS